MFLLLACLDTPPPAKEPTPAPVDADGDGYLLADGDCDDQDPEISPAAEEACDSPIDQNCDGVIPSDIDGDGFLCEDCNNSDPQVYPGAPEFCDGVDQDCNGRLDNDPVDAPLWYPDQDGDSYGDPRFERDACTAPASDYVNNGDDCDDSTADAAPGLPEVCGDGLDTNCDGRPGDCTVEGELSAMARLTGDAQGAALGTTVANLGDANGDGLNDIWMPLTRGARNYELKIFNRWGQMVFTTNKQDQGWDGLNALEGVYVYTLSFVNGYDKRISEKGVITLMR